MTTAYTGDNKVHIATALAGLFDCLRESYDIHTVYLPLLGATLLGPRDSYEQIVKGLQNAPMRLSLKVVIIVLPGAIPQGELVNLEGDAASVVLSRAAYSCDAVDGCDVVDSLGVAPQAWVLAGLLADRNVAMPLAVGLFGHWGSGKSFFMRLLKQAMEEMVAAKAPHQVDDVLPIHFNAWHYMDSDLWASLARVIFDGIAGHLSPEKDEEAPSPRERLMSEIESSKYLKDQAEGELARAKEVRQKLSKKIQDRFKYLYSTEKGKAFHELMKLLGIKDLPETVTQMQLMVREARTVKGVVVGLLSGKIFVWVPGLSFLLFAGGAGYLLYAQQINSITAMLAPPLASLAGVFAWILPRLKKTVTGLQGARQWLAQAQDVLHDDGELHALQQQIAALDRQVAEAAAKVAHIDQGGAVYDFMQERGRSKDYVDRQGIVATLRKDLEGLQKLWDELAKDGKRDRRIVLYVDDLDRCDPNRVVEVLQAVHLLLAFPLFAVVVAVDPRWLEHALYKRYLPGHEGMTDVRRLSSQFSPQNYLEKIFQIPVRVGAASLSKGRYDDLIDTLAAPAPKRPQAAQAVPSVADVVPQIVLPADQAEELGGAPQAVPDPDPAAQPADPVPAPDVPPLELEDAEKALMKALAPLLPTPRTVKRLYNVYALIRLEKAQQQNLSDFLLNDFRLLLLMLAVDFGFPLPSRFVRAGIRDGADLREWVGHCLDRCANAGLTALAAEFLELKKALSLALENASLRSLTVSPSILDLVSRFSFHDPLSLSEVLELEKAAYDSDTPPKST